MKSIGIIGGSGYIGLHLIEKLAADFAVTSLQRNVNAIMPQVKNISIRSIETNDQTFDILINTSYNLGKDIEDVYKQNEAVLKAIQKASHAQTKIIHLSSLAVFGFGLDKPIQTSAVKLENDYGYVLSKVHMENCLLETIPANQLSIIRLGNVWGPANNSWTQPVADALQWELPVLSQSPAYSNITYIHHISDYISFLIHHTEHRVFHHLAEFSRIGWPQIVQEISERLNVTPAPITHIPFYAKNLSDDLQNSLSIHPITTLKNLRDGRFSSFYFPKKMMLLLQKKLAKKSTTTVTLKQTAYHPDPTFYWILTCKQEFKTETLPGWNPPHSWEDVNEQVSKWLEEAGYTIAAN